MDLDTIRAQARKIAADSERIRPPAVSAITSLSVRKVQEMAAAGAIPSAIKADDGWTFDEKKVRTWLRKMERENAKGVNRPKPRPIELLSASDIAAYARPWPSCGTGIYFLLKKGAVVYVGRALRVTQRIGWHIGTKDFDAWHWVPCAERHLDRTERAYINALMPPLNLDPITQRIRKAQERD